MWSESIGMGIDAGKSLPYSMHNPLLVAVHYWPDWLALGVVGAVCGLTGLFERTEDRFFITSDPSLNYPFLPNTVSTMVMMLYGVGIPLVVCLLLNAVLARAHIGWAWGLDVHHFTLSFVSGHLICQAFTLILKEVVGRIRPSGVARLNSADGDTHGYNLSFPSGHTSLTFCGMVFLALYLSGKFGTFRAAGLLARKDKADAHVGSLAVVLLTVLAPLSLACYVMATRLTDYAHDFADVNMGVMIGTASAVLTYFTAYPALSHEFCHLPSPLAQIGDADVSAHVEDVEAQVDLS